MVFILPHKAKKEKSAARTAIAERVPKNKLPNVHDAGREATNLVDNKPDRGSSSRGSENLVPPSAASPPPDSAPPLPRHRYRCYNLHRHDCRGGPPCPWWAGGAPAAAPSWRAARTRWPPWPPLSIAALCRSLAWHASEGTVSGGGGGKKLHTNW